MKRSELIKALMEPDCVDEECDSDPEVYIMTDSCEFQTILSVYFGIDGDIMIDVE